MLEDMGRNMTLVVMSKTFFTLNILGKVAQDPVEVTKRLPAPRIHEQ
jgi:hypothetical protein